MRNPKPDRLNPKKHLGQHFLHDQQVASRIVDTLQATPDQPVVEIGPGEGVLTHRLAARYPDLTLIEVDPEAVAHLQRHLPPPQPRIVHTDVLKWDLPGSLPGPAAFIGNLPYNISSPIFFQLLEQRAYVAEGVFMIQKEVAERICAPPGSKTYGILSVLLQAYFEVGYAFSVPPGAFRPPPKVMSGVIRLVPRPDPPAVAFEPLRRVVKAAFQQRRKTLRNALKGLALPASPEWEAWAGQRAEQLSVADFVRLAQQLP